MNARIAEKKQIFFVQMGLGSYLFLKLLTFIKNQIYLKLKRAIFRYKTQKLKIKFPIQVALKFRQYFELSGEDSSVKDL